MTERRKSVRGSGRDRGGATDTTMLIWKIIDANPGITCDEIWEQVEDRIPMGYALRLYSRSSVAGGSATDDRIQRRMRPACLIGLDSPERFSPAGFTAQRAAARIVAGSPRVDLVAAHFRSSRGRMGRVSSVLVMLR